MLTSLLCQENETVRHFRQDALHFCCHLRPALQQVARLTGRMKPVVLGHMSWTYAVVAWTAQGAGDFCVIPILLGVCLQPVM